jgi:hypothetical protein
MWKKYSPSEDEPGIVSCKQGSISLYLIVAKFELMKNFRY